MLGKFLLIPPPFLQCHLNVHQISGRVHRYDHRLKNMSELSWLEIVTLIQLKYAILHMSKYKYKFARKLRIGIPLNTKCVSSMSIFSKKIA
jgi:hypothetical protein